MLHAVAAGPRQVVGEKGVGAALECGKLAEDRQLFADDALGIGGERVGFGVGAVVVQRDAERGGSPAAAAPATLKVRSVWALNSDGLSIRYWRLGAVNVSGSLVGYSCVATRHWRPGRLLERDARRPVLEPARPHQRRRHVDVGVRGVDAQVGAVHAIAEDGR